MKRRLSVLLLVLAMSTAALAHVDGHQSVHDVIASVMERMKASLPHDSLAAMTEARAAQFLTEDELHVLGTEYLSFTVNVPATVSIMRYAGQRTVPYWLEAAGFRATGDTVVTGNRKAYEVWQKSVQPGRVGLGVNGFDGNSRCYFVAVGPANPGDSLGISDIYPGRHTATRFTSGELVYADSPHYALNVYPESLEGTVMLRGVQERSSQTRLAHVFRVTPFPATPTPDQIALTWSENPQTTQTVQWRTSTAVSETAVRFRCAQGGSTAQWQQIRANAVPLRDEFLINDQVCHRYSAVMRGLRPGMTYIYSVGNPETNEWSIERQFTTAPAGPEAFSFIYMGDVQNGIDAWETMVEGVYRDYPQAAFYVLAGDLVNRGTQRDDWDQFFHSARNVFSERPVVPVLGNHEHQGGHGPWMYLRNFTLPENGPMEADRERAYSLRYGNALFLILDSNQPVDTQAAWIEEQLANTDAVWKFVSYHHPAYSSGPTRDNPDIRETWGALFDRYHVDMALQGHDHAYLRTWPMRGGQRVDSAAEGTYYIVSSAGSKFYGQGEFDYTAVGFTNTSMFQVLDIRIQGHRLHYRAYDAAGVLRDEIVIEK